MTDTVIQVENLGKKYIIQQQQEGAYRYKALRDVMANGVKSLGQKLRHPGKALQSADQEEFWALKDISFEVTQGDVVGIIGRNGAGKSTLLKLLSRITEPTTGRIRIKGRIASLLEVGTGFHPELTGRENIFLNGVILGMSKAEIAQKFDKIVAFAEIERFLDTPVKRYSSGMYVRLAFAVASHLEPEILIVDEVLAVGDATFQKKCLTKIKDVSGQGRTVLFVSHNMGVISSLCERVILLETGKINCDNNPSTVIAKYLDSNLEVAAKVDLWGHPGRSPKMKQALVSACLKQKDQQPCFSFNISEKWILEVVYINNSGKSFIGIGFGIYTVHGVRVGGFNTCMAQHPPYEIPTQGRVIFSVPQLGLCPGKYSITLSVGSNQQGFLYDQVQNAIQFEVNQNDVYGTGWLLTPEDGVHVMYADCKILAKN